MLFQFIQFVFVLFFRLAFASAASIILFLAIFSSLMALSAASTILLLAIFSSLMALFTMASVFVVSNFSFKRLLISFYLGSLTSDSSSSFSRSSNLYNFF